METYEDQLIQVPDCFGADQKLNYVIKGIVQMSLNTNSLEALITSLEAHSSVWPPSQSRSAP